MGGRIRAFYFLGQPLGRKSLKIALCQWCERGFTFNSPSGKCFNQIPPCEWPRQFRSGRTLTIRLHIRQKLPLPELSKIAAFLTVCSPPFSLRLHLDIQLSPATLAFNVAFHGPNLDYRDRRGWHEVSIRTSSSLVQPRAFFQVSNASRAFGCLVNTPLRFNSSALSVMKVSKSCPSSNWGYSSFSLSSSSCHFASSSASIISLSLQA